MHTKAHINVTLDAKVLRWIDTLRGQAPRSTFINNVLSRFCAKSQAVFDWDVESQAAEADLQHGRVRTFRTPDEAIRWLNS
jgi:hypothetical protein